MSETTLNPNAAEMVVSSGATPADEAQPDTTALATMNGNTALAAPTLGDSVLPSHILRVTYGMGFAKDQGFPSGAFSLGTDLLLTAPPKERTLKHVIVVDYQTYWRYWPLSTPEGQSAPEKQIFPTREAAKMAGRVTEYGPYGSGAPRRNCAMCVRMNLFVRQPASVVNHLPFCLLLGGHRYAIASIFVEKTLFGKDERRSQVMGMLENLRRSEAADRGVSPDKGKTDKYFCELALVPEASKKDPSRTFYTLHLNPMMTDDGKAFLEIGDDVKNDIATLAASLANAKPVEGAEDADVADAETPF